MTTTLPIESEVVKNWYVVDATDKPAGRLAVIIACYLRGKNRPDYAPHIDMGDFIVVVNAEKIKLTGDKEEKKIYKHYTGYQGGLKEFPAKFIRERNPTRIITQAVKGMLPKNKLNRKIIKRLKVYVGPNHPHEAQNPQPLGL